MLQFHPLRTWFSATPASSAISECLWRLFPPQDDGWRSLLPGYAACVAFTRLGLPFHAVLQGSHDEGPQHDLIPDYLEAGKSIILLQPHELMPRLMRLIVALRAAFFGPFCDESSYLFMAGGKGKPGMSPHHDGEAHSFWLQLAGRRTVTIGPQAPPGSPVDAPAGDAGGPGWSSFDLGPGSLFYMQPRVLHEVVCREPSLALSLTWELLPGHEVLGAWLEEAARQAPSVFDGISSAGSPAGLVREIEKSLHALAPSSLQKERLGHQLFAESLTQWPVAPGKIVRKLPDVQEPIPVPVADRSLLWAQRPAAIMKCKSTRTKLISGDKTIAVHHKADLGRLSELPYMPCWQAQDWETADPRLLGRLVSEGILASRDLPLLVYPDDVDGLSGWDFASQDVD